MAKKPKKKQKVNINNPFVLLQVMLISLVRLVGIIIGNLLALLMLAIHKWVASLLILAALFITLYTLGVL